MTETVEFRDSDAVAFQPWPKIARLNKNVILTEKIDGTNAAIGVREVVEGSVPVQQFETVVFVDGCDAYALRAQSRKRFITPDSDNFGFASWAFDNAEILAPFLWEGLHYGEWWGQGIQRGYGLERKHFSLFNTGRWAEPLLYDATEEILDLGLDVVPVLGIWGGNDIGRGLRQVLADLSEFGSQASRRAEGVIFPKPEGVMTYWTASNTLHKYIIENPDTPKSEWPATAEAVSRGDLTLPTPGESA